jgi:hypothetical protein
MDYAALAAQFGGQSSATPDYADLAAQFGGKTGSGYDAAAQNATFAPTNGMSTLDRLAASAGKAVADTGRGLRQIYASAADAVAPQSSNLTSLITGQRPTRSAAIQSEIDDAKRLDAPLMATGAGVAGNIAGNVAMVLLPAAGIVRGAGVLAKTAQAVNATRGARAATAIGDAAGAVINPQTYLGAAGAGAALGAVQPVASDDSRLLNAGMGAAGGAGGQAVVNALGRIAQPVKNALDPLRQKAVDVLTNAGVPLDLAQVTGSPMWNRVRSALSDNLFTAGAQEAKRAEQGAAFNNAALGTIGAAGPSATSDVMRAADDRIGAVFKDVLDRNDVKADPSWIGRLAQTHAGALENEKQPVVNIINRILDSVNNPAGQMSGQLAYGIKKDLDRMAMSQDTTQAHFARQARSALMDGINGSLSGPDQAAFAQARGQFANMSKIEGAIDKEGTGNISPSRLANILGQKSNRDASIYGRGPQELVDLAQSGKQVLPDKLGNSGTAARLLAAAAPGALLGVGTGLATGDWTKAGEYGTMAFAAPKAAQLLLNNPAAVNYLSSGIRDPLLRSALTAPQSNAAVGQLLRQSPNALARLLLPAPQQ